MDIQYVKSKLLDNGKPVMYDIKDEFKKELNILECDSNLTKLKKYQARPSDSNCIDCDVSEFAVFIYHELWDFLNSYEQDKQKGTSYKYELKKEEEYYRGDTMVSFNRTKNASIKFKNNEINIEIEKFAKLYHTIGNMIPIPLCFNYERSGNGWYDYWDLAMQNIKEWYRLKDNHEERKVPLRQLLNPIGKNKDIEKSIELCEKWLSNFDTWNDFVNANYLEVYIEEENGTLKKDENGDFIPIELWEGHSYENSNLPKDEQKFLNYLKRLNKIIVERNIIYDI